ncbi:hypothetical protein [Kineococcus sp. SYSU DK002]|uniref:hypothetical protein n=1 Tax=Kineococcus sp. SYSU DK002 TaxID=3383123 RepID=UPI003D7E44F8
MQTVLPTTGAAGPAVGALRLLRAGGVAATVLGLAAGSHASAGGALPGPFLLGAVAVLLVALCLLPAGRRLTWPVLTVLLGGGQFALHALFETCSGPSYAVVSTGHHQTLVPLGRVVLPAVPSLPMTCAHVLATGLALLALLHAEGLLWSLWAWLRPLARVARAAAVPVPGPRPRARAQERPRPRWVVVRRVRRRGPPRVPALATTS